MAARLLSAVALALALVSAAGDASAPAAALRGTDTLAAEQEETPTEARAESPTAAPSAESPRAASAESPRAAPAASPREAPAESPTEAPAASPTEAPAQSPTEAPAQSPTEAPAQSPTEAPAQSPTEAPAQSPTEAPAQSPTEPAQGEQSTNMLTPHNSTEPFEALTILRQMMVEELHAEHWQWLVTLLTFCLGVVAVAFPERAFNYIVVAVIFAVMYTMAMGDLYQRYKDEHIEGAIMFNGVMLWQIIVSIEVAACASVVAWKGIDGVKTLISMVLFVFPLKFVQGCLVNSGMLGASPWWNIIVVTLSAGIGFYIMSNHNLELLLGFVFPLFGGKLISCSTGWCIFYLLDHTWSKAWLDFYHSLPCDLTRNAFYPAPGIGWSTPSGVGPVWGGWVLGTMIWLGIAVGSVVYHHNQVAKKKTGGNKVDKTSVEKADSKKEALEKADSKKEALLGEHQQQLK